MKQDFEFDFDQGYLYQRKLCSHTFSVQFWYDFKQSSSFVECNVSQGDQRGGLHMNWWTWIKFKKNTKTRISLSLLSQLFLNVFKICLYGGHFDSSVCPQKVFWQHFADSSKHLKNHLIAENLNEVKSSSLIKWFFKSLKELVKCCQKILCGHTDESKCPPYRHILKTVVKEV